MDGENNTTQLLKEPDVGSESNAEEETCASSFRQAGGKRKRKDRRLGKYLDLVEVLIVAIETDQTISVINRKGCEILGYKKEELIGKNWFDTCLLEEDREPLRTEFKRVIAGEIEPVRSGKLPVLTKSGETRWLSWHNTELKNRKGEITAALCSGEDITQQIKTEEELRKAEERVRLKLESLLSPEGDLGNLELADIFDVPVIQSLMEGFYEVARIPIGIIDLKGKVLVGVGWQDICTRFHRVNPETCRYCIESDTQLSAGVPAGKFKLYKCRNNMWDAATPIIVGDRHMGNVFYGQFFFDDETLDYGLFRSQARQYGFPEKEYIAALELVPRLSRESLNTAMAFFTKLAYTLSKLSYRNIKLARLLTERNSLMNSLQTAENKYRGIFENAIEGIFRTAPDGRVLDANPAFAQILGYDSPEEMKRAITDIGKQHYVDPGARKKWISFIDQNNFGRFEVPMSRKDGVLCWVCLSAHPVRNAQGETSYYEGFAEDVTERKRIEEELKQYRDHLEILVKERTSQLEENNRLLTGEIAERKKVEEALRESENKYRTIFENTGTATLIYEEDSTISLEIGRAHV
jgi:PAS domain S-box-containing protein